MNKLFVVAAVAAIVLATSGGKAAHAQGVHLGMGPVHVDVGRAHGGYGGYGYRPYYQGGGHAYRGGYGGGWGGYRGHYDRHDTSHFDVHPGGYERHYNHYDYAPAHYDYHSQGHFDYHR